MNYFPIFLDLNDEACLVIGAGSIAARKIQLLTRSGARVTVVAPRVCAEVREAAEQGRIELLRREFEHADLNGRRLVFAATGDNKLNTGVAAACKQLSIPVNVVDRTALCTFIMPSIIDRSPIIAAVSTGGNAPALARLMRGRLEAAIPAGLGKVAALAGEFREKAKLAFSSTLERRRFWESTFEGEVAELVFAGRESEARAKLDLQLANPESSPTGQVFLVGAGPGDPDLLTFKALRLMQRADIVLYDRLVSPAVLELVRRDAELIYVGKSRGDHAVDQHVINQLLVDYARQGKSVLRLKGGDPFIFGRGGEEIDTLAEQGISFQVVPGITAASGCAAYAGIPLTHRDYAQSCVFVTGHLKNGTIDLNWDALTHTEQTLVFYMGLVGLPVIIAKLMEHGLSPDTPCALIQQGTMSDQRVFTAPLSELTALAEREQPKAPTLLIVGHVVSLREKLNWFQPGTNNVRYDMMRATPV